MNIKLGMRVHVNYLWGGFLHSYEGTVVYIYDEGFPFPYLVLVDGEYRLHAVCRKEVIIL